MSKVINCECGYVVRGESDEEILAEAHRHVRADHPELVDKVSDEQFLAMAEEQ